MSTFIKICGLRDAESVAAAVKAGADAVGFVFAKSVRQVSPAQAQSISQTVAQDVQRVAVMRHPTNAEWQDVLDTFAPDVLQTDIEDFEQIDVPEHIEKWPVIREGSAAANGELAGVFVYEGKVSGAGATVDWSLAAGIAARGRMILAGGLTPGNVAVAIAAASPWGVDVSSGVESRPGHKDRHLIEAFIGAVRAAEKDG